MSSASREGQAAICHPQSAIIVPLVWSAMNSSPAGTNELVKRNPGNGQIQGRGSAVPMGRMSVYLQPGVETPGYCRVSLWDEGLVGTIALRCPRWRFPVFGQRNGELSGGKDGKFNAKTQRGQDAISAALGLGDFALNSVAGVAANGAAPADARPEGLAGGNGSSRRSVAQADGRLQKPARRKGAWERAFSRREPSPVGAGLSPVSPGLSPVSLRLALVRLGLAKVRPGKA
jgi:hypothetical protein